MWIETDDQLLNTANIDTIFKSNINDQFFLIAQKNFNDFQMAEYVLAEGSRERIETQYNRIRDAVRSGDHFVKVYSRKQIPVPANSKLKSKPEKPKRQGPLVPAFGDRPLIDLDDDFDF